MTYAELKELNSRLLATRTELLKLWIDYLEADLKITDEELTKELLRVREQISKAVDCLETALFNK